MEVKEMLIFLENKEKELGTYKEANKETVRELCTDKNKKIIEFNEIYAIENILHRLEQLEKENEELKEKMKKAYTYITDEMYVDDNPTICGDEEDTITELPISLNLYNEDLRELLELLGGSNE